MRFFLPILLFWSFSVFASDNILKDGGFETPVVKARTLKESGGDPTNNGKGPGWVVFKFRNGAKNGKITGGLTNEIARTGSQSLFIHFDHVSAPLRNATLVSNFVPVVSGSEYEISIWGRTDAKDAIGSNGRSAYLKLEIDYFAADGNTSIGDPFQAVEPLPGSKDRAPNFVATQWNRFFTRLTPPAGAIFAQITWSWETGSDSGEINGIMYFDDVSLAGPAAANPDMTPIPVEEPSPTPEASASPASQ